jgi:hypothetical protein
VNLIGFNPAYRQQVDQYFCPNHPGHCVPAFDCWIEQQFYAAVCREGQCLAVDIRTEDLTACTTSADCRLRWGVACCENCNASPTSTPNGLVSVNAQSFDQSVCGSAPCAIDCMPPAYPTNAVPGCLAGHCTVWMLD